MPPACCERARAAVSPVSVQPITWELSSHVWVSDFTWRAPVWRKHGNLCWQKKQLGKRLEYFWWNAFSDALALAGKLELCLWISMLYDPRGENFCVTAAHLLSSLFCPLLSFRCLSWTRFPGEYLCFNLMLVHLMYRWKLWKLLKSLCSVMWKFGLNLKVREAEEPCCYDSPSMPSSLLGVGCLRVWLHVTGELMSLVAAAACISLHFSEMRWVVSGT